jgi:hypothetical protein
MLLNMTMGNIAKVGKATQTPTTPKGKLTNILFFYPRINLILHFVSNTKNMLEILKNC